MKRGLNLSLKNKGLILVAVPLCFELIFIASLFLLMKHAERIEIRAKRAEEIIKITTVLSKDLMLSPGVLISSVSKTALPAYDAALFPVDFANLDDKAMFDQLSEDIKRQSDNLAKLLLEEQVNAYHVPELKRSIAQLLTVMEEARIMFSDPETTSVLKNLNIANAKSIFRRVKSANESINAQLGRIVPLELRTTGELSREINSIVELSGKWLIIGGLLNVAITIWMAIYFSSSIVSRISILINNSRRLANQQELIPRIEGDDELGELDSAFHQMAEQLTTLQKKERALIEYMPVGLVAVSGIGIIESVNPRMSEMFQLTGSAVGKSLKSFVSDSDYLSDESFMLSLMQNTFGRSTVVDAVRENGTTFKAEISLSLYDQDAVRKALVNFVDVTERFEMERLKREFTSIVSHEIRTPLTSMQLFVELLTMGRIGELTESGKKTAESVQFALQRLMRLINDLLRFEKMAAGKLELERENVVLADAVNEAIDSVNGLANQKGIQIEKSGRDSFTVEVDKDRIVQVLINFLSNAIKYSPTDSRIEVAVSEIDQFVEVRVIDFGEGIPADALERIFLPFEQARASDEKIKQGSGLGLSICKAIIEQHGGTIGCESEEGSGSQFWFHIPL